MTFGRSGHPCHRLELRSLQKDSRVESRGVAVPLSNGREQNVIGTINLPQTAALQRNHPNESLRSRWPRPHHISSCMRDAADIRHEYAGFPGILAPTYHEFANG